MFVAVECLERFLRWELRFLPFFSLNVVKLREKEGMLMLRVDQTLLQQVILSRHSDSYKGDYGRLLLIGGTYPYGGAIIMAALAAVHS